MSFYVLYGAGAVGGVIGGRLARAGHDVTLVARGEHLARILADGLVLDTAEGRYAVRAAATDTAAGIEWRDDTVVLLAVKSHQTDAALADLVRHAPGTVPVVCVQNGVSNEPATLRRFAHTYAVTVMLPSQHLEPGVVVQGCHPVPGILDIGRYPSGTDQVTERVSDDLRSAGFESVPRPDIMAWKYRKLVTNAVGDVSAVLPDEADELKPAGPRRGRGGARRSGRACGEPRGRPRAPRRPAPGPRRRARTQLARSEHRAADHRHRGRLPGRRDRAARAAARRTDPGQRAGPAAATRELDVPDWVSNLFPI